MSASIQSFAQRLRSQPLRVPFSASPELWAYREAAAVLACFDYAKLQPFLDDPASLNPDRLPEALAQLLADCDSVGARTGTPRWSLRTSLRRTCLARLFARGKLQAAVRANIPEDRSLTQVTLERCLQDGAPAFGPPANVDEAAALLEVSYWVEEVPKVFARLPPRPELRAFLAREQFLEPFRSLVGLHFAGRQRELNELSNYVGVFNAHGVTASFRQLVENVFDIRERPPLFVLGPGGCGKSTLLAKFILDHIHNPIQRLPVAYLDFDRPALSAQEPITLLFEVMRQLVDQFPQYSGSYQEIASLWTARIEEQQTQADNEEPAVEPDIARTGTVLRMRDRDLFFDEFAKFVRQLSGGERAPRLLLVLDTFEEVQFRSSAQEDEVFDSLNSLQRRVPGLRTVLCGRVPINSRAYKVNTLEIGNFDEDTAVAFLANFGITDTRQSRSLVRQVGTSPLVLRLAAEVALQEPAGPDGIRDLNTGWFSSFRRQRIEVVLYKRILSHVYDKRVEQVAYPGLALRTITPEIVLEVLAPVCEVSVVGLDDARQLMTTMRKQLSTLLLTAGSNERLVHRPDMRRILVEDLAERSSRDAAFGTTLIRLHERAVAFYSERSGLENRAEELFHRLALNQPRATVDARWQDGLAPYLASAIEELPISAQSLLAARLGYEVPEQVWRSAANADWMQLAIRRSEEYLRMEKPRAAYDLLQERRQLWEDPLLAPQVRTVVDALLTQAARNYESVRNERANDERYTRKIDGTLSEVRQLANEINIDAEWIERIFARGTPGDRMVAIILAQVHPDDRNTPIAIEAIGKTLSALEQYQGMVLANIQKTTPPEFRDALRSALLAQRQLPFDTSDASRAKLRAKLLARLNEGPGVA